MVALSVVFMAACSSSLSLDTSVKANSSRKLSTNLPSSSTEGMITKEALRRDFEQLTELLDSVHPEPSFTMNLETVKRKIEELSADIKGPMDQLDAWKYMAQLNPYFNDGHMAVFYPSLNEGYNKHQASGGSAFPLKVKIDESNRIFVSTNEYAETGIKLGHEIKSINGVSAMQVAHEIVSRMHGDSIAHRAALASDRFEKMYWLMFGDPKQYLIEVTEQDQINKHVLNGAQSKSTVSNPKITDFLSRKILEGNIGYLRVDRFYYPAEFEQAFFSYMDETWREFNGSKVQDVIIDVRTNPGGTDHYWQLGIAPYVAKEAFSFFSKYKIRLTERNIKLGPMTGELGTILEGPYNELIPISGKEDLKIPGKTYLLMGPLSYSSTVLFLTAFQDSEQALVAGPRSGVRSCTTGRIHPFELTSSKLEVTVPTLIFTRAAGEENCHRPIEPDVVVSDDIAGTENAVDRLAEIIRLQSLSTTKG